jgi:hypothetical protein
VGGRGKREREQEDRERRGEELLEMIRGKRKGHMQ